MKRILILLILLSFAFGQNDNIGSEAVKKTFDANLHLPRDRTFSSGVLVVLRSLEDGASIDSSGMAISDTSVGARAGAHLIQDGSVFYASAADIDLLLGLAGKPLLYDSTGIIVNAPRTIYGWSHNLVFSATNYNTIAWTSGDLYFANLDTFEIVSGNTGNISDITYIYFDEDASSTVLQTTTNAGNSVGGGRVIVCVGEDVASPKDAVYQVFGGEGGGQLVTIDNLAVNSVSANEIISNSITLNEINFKTIDGDSLITQINSVGTTLYITADVINAVSSSDAGRRIEINPSTDRITFYDATREILSIGENVFGSIDGMTIDSGMVYISTKDNGAYSQLHIENFAQSGSGWQGLQTLYLSNDATSSVTANPTDAWVVSKIEGERNNAGKKLYGIYANINNSGTGTANAYGIDLDIDANDGIAYGVLIRSNSTDGIVYGLRNTARSLNNTTFGIYSSATGGEINYGIWANAVGGTTDWAGYFAAGNVKILDNLEVDGTIDGATLNTGQGDNELYDMNQNVQTSNTVRFAKVEIDGASNYIDTDTGELELISNGAMSFYASADGFIFNDDLTVGANKLIGATLNTGQGDNNLFDMNQNVQTSDAVTFTTVGIAELASAPNHTAGIGKLWAKNDTFAPLRYTTDNGEDLWVSVAEVKGTTGHPSGWEGKIEINTFNNKVYIYAEGIWRQLATW